MHRLYCSQIPTGGINITSMDKETQEETNYALAKTMFELGRRLLINPDLTGDALWEWQRRVKFDEYTGPLLLTCREIQLSDLPTDRYFRDAWEDDGTKIGVDLPKTRAIHINRIRIVRNQELEKESGSRFRQPPEIEALFTSARRAKLKTLRDIPQGVQAEMADKTSPEEIRALWPVDLPRWTGPNSVC